MPSPCIDICRIDRESGLCLGCVRSRAEIKAWRDMTPEEQRVLMGTLGERLGMLSERARRERLRLMREGML